jgi:hypothetical protein
MLGYVWGRDGTVWALRVVTTAPIGFPVAWAGLFLTFPNNRLRGRAWKLHLTVLCGLAVVASTYYLIRLFVVLPDVLTTVFIDPVLPYGLLLGLAGISLGAQGETAQARQQRRLVALSAASAVLPFLLLSFLPDVVLGHVLAPYEITAFAFVMLPPRPCVRPGPLRPDGT